MGDCGAGQTRLRNKDGERLLKAPIQQQWGGAKEEVRSALLRGT